MFKLSSSSIAIIEESVNESILNILKKISSRYSIDLKELKNVAFNKEESKEEDIEELEISKPATKSSVAKESKKSDNKEVIQKKCAARKESGKNKGEPCESKVCAESTTGNFCKKHLKLEQVSKIFKPDDLEDTKEKKENSATHRASDKSVKTKKEENEFINTPKKEVQSLIEKRTKNLTVKKNKWGNYEHTTSKLVLDPVTKRVIGKQSDDGSIYALSTSDIELAKDIGLEYDLPKTIKTTESKKINVDSEDDDDIDEEELLEDDCSEDDE
jgi:hypothetical protein